MLTPQQEALKPIIADHVASRDSRMLVIEGVSGVGKSTLVRKVLAEMGKTSVLVADDLSYNEQELRKGEAADIGIVDYSFLSGLGRIQSALKDRVKSTILLAHPRLVSNKGLKRTDHLASLEEAGFPAVLHPLGVMNFEESRAYAASLGLTEDPSDFIGKYGLGIAGHIKALLADPKMDDNRAQVLAVAKLRQILNHASQYHDNRMQRAAAILGTYPNGGLQAQLNSPFHTLEEELANVDEDIADRLPLHEETLETYRTLLERGECYMMQLFIPDADESVSKEFGLNGSEISPEGRLMKFSGSQMKAGFVTRHSHSSHYAHRGSTKGSRDFNDWLKDMLPKIPVEAGKNPLYIAAHSHGGCRMVDSPLFTYGAETYLQAKGITYYAEYILGAPNSIRHLVTAEGVKVI